MAEKNQNLSIIHSPAIHCLSSFEISPKQKWRAFPNPRLGESPNKAPFITQTIPVGALLKEYEIF